MHIHIHTSPSLSSCLVVFFLLRIISLDEALSMSRGAPLISAQPEIRNEESPHGASTDDQEAANNGVNISSYDDPPLEQLDEIEDGSLSVEENAWRGEDPPEEVPHDEYAGSEYEEDMPDDEMASRAGEGHQGTRASGGSYSTRGARSESEPFDGATRDGSRDAR